LGQYQLQIHQKGIPLTAALANTTASLAVAGGDLGGGLRQCFVLTSLFFYIYFFDYQ